MGSLVGEWTAPCDAWGTPAQCRLTWSAGHHAKQYRLGYLISAKEGRKTLFEGSATYQSGDASLEGFWADSNGALHPIFARWEGGELISHWGHPSTEQGRSHYKLNGDDSLTVTDWVLTREGWREFMRVEYRRMD